MQLHWLHVARKEEITGVMHGKNMVLSACAVIKVMPWCAECWTVRTCCQSEGGMTMWSL